MFFTLCLLLDQTTAGTAETVYAALPAGAFGKAKIVGAEFIPDANRTASDTDYATLAIKVGATTIGSIATTTTGTGNLVAGTAVSITLTGEEAVPLTAGGSNSCSAAVTKSGSGVAFTGTVVLLCEAVRA
jgi:hypothetical protein